MYPRAGLDVVVKVVVATFRNPKVWSGDLVFMCVRKAFVKSGC